MERPGDAGQNTLPPLAGLPDGGIPGAALDAGGIPGADGPATSAPTDGPGEPPSTGQTVVVTAFSAAHVYFAGMDNKRRLDAPVAFPARGPWKNVTLRLKLGCPGGRCDFWDRWAYLGVVEGAGDGETITEIMRFVTPYRVTADWTADVTSLQPLLSGERKLAVFIDTWVGPGHPQGQGWLVDASFTFTPGMPERLPTAVIPLWGVSNFEVGDPTKPVATARPARTVSIPAGTTAVELRSFVTGHGQGNLQNCAEFCPKNHRFTVAGMPFDRRIWRDDCARTAVPNQAGTYMASRAGWCPGALVTPWVADVTAAARPGGDVTVTYAPEAYENSCRPDAPVCAGCALRTACEYDNGLHTAPGYTQSAVVIVYGGTAALP